MTRGCETPQARWASSPTRQSSSFSPVLIHPQPQDRPLAYAIVRVCAAGMPHLLCPPALNASFSRYLELSHRQIPDVNMSAQAPPGLRAPVIPARKQPAPATKRKPAPLICRHLGFRTFRETAFFAPAPAPCPVQVNLRSFQMTKCQIPGKIAKCQIRRSVPAGKHENVPRCISTAPLRPLRLAGEVFLCGRTNDGRQYI